MRLVGFFLIAGFIFAFSPAADWMARNTPDWVGALILVIGFPLGLVALLKILFTFARGADK
jgi:uncharacterized protein involved in cysteine biosynthesis